MTEEKRPTEYQRFVDEMLAPLDWMDSLCPLCGERLGAHKAMPGWMGNGCPPKKDAPTQKPNGLISKTKRELGFDHPFEHGIDCVKIRHDRTGGYLHDRNDDRPYDVEGLMYCGRCHQWLGK